MGSGRTHVRMRAGGRGAALRRNSGVDYVCKLATGTCWTNRKHSGSREARAIFSVHLR